MLTLPKREYSNFLPIGLGIYRLQSHLRCIINCPRCNLVASFASPDILAASADQKDMDSSTAGQKLVSCPQLFRILDLFGQFL